MTVENVSGFTPAKSVPSDRALVGWAMCVQDATWTEWPDGKGEFCFAGLRYVTSLDEFGCPRLSGLLLENLSAAFADWAERSNIAPAELRGEA